MMKTTTVVKISLALLALLTIILLTSTASATSEWQTPTVGYCTGQACDNAVDDDTATEAAFQPIHTTIELNTDTSIYSDGIRIMARDFDGSTFTYGPADALIRVYYSGSYHTIYDGELTQNDWQSIYLSSPQQISKINITFKNFPPGSLAYALLKEIDLHHYTTTTPVTSITSSSVRLNQYMGFNSTTSYGWWIGETTPVNSSNSYLNISVTSGSMAKGDKSIVNNSVNHSTYYYVRAWTKNSTTFENSTNEVQFLTKPAGPPDDFEITDYDGTTATLSWNNVTTNCNNQTTLVYYTKDINSDGTLTNDDIIAAQSNLAYNGTAETTTITGLEPDTFYWILAYTQINDTGSPRLYQESSTYATASCTTTGGTYNITIRYENETYNKVDLTLGNPHQLIVHYSDRTEINWFNGSDWNYNETYLTDSDATDGNFSITIEDNPLWFEFHWNDSTSRTYRCNRMIVPITGSRNITFYIRTDLPIYLEGSTDLNGSLVRYTYTYIDETGDYRSTNDPYSTIYAYDDDGNKLIIHSEYFSVSLETYPWLVYGKKYFIGTACTEASIERIGIAPAGETQTATVIIPLDPSSSYTMFDLINIDVSWYDDGFYVDFQDTTATTEEATFYVYNYTTGDLIYSDSVETNSNSFTFSTVDGCELNTKYKWKLQVNLTDQSYDTGQLVIFPGFSTITDVTSIDDIIDQFLGDPPIHNPDTGAYVPWTYLLIFGLAFSMLALFGKENGFLGCLAAGAILIISGVAIGGMDQVFTGYGWYEGARVAVVGALLFVLGLIGLLGGDN